MYDRILFLDTDPTSHETFRQQYSAHGAVAAGRSSIFHSANSAPRAAENTSFLGLFGCLCVVGLWFP